MKSFYLQNKPELISKTSLPLCCCLLLNRSLPPVQAAATATVARPHGNCASLSNPQSLRRLLPLLMCTRVSHSAATAATTCAHQCEPLMSQEGVVGGKVQGLSCYQQVVSSSNFSVISLKRLCLHFDVVGCQEWLFYFSLGLLHVT